MSLSLVLAAGLDIGRGIWYSPTITTVYLQKTVQLQLPLASAA